jgi:alkylation response protein AidB-like acyl-CoA dehydrogenase
MNISLNSEQKLIQDTMRALVTSSVSPEALRKLVDSGRTWDEKLWAELAELGVLGANIPEEYGGVGLGPVDTAVVAMELGRATAPVPFLSSVCMATEALLLCGTPAQKETWLPRLARGEVVGTLAWTEGNVPPSLGLATMALENGRLTGDKLPVPDAHLAQLCIVLVRSQGRPGLALVQLDDPTVTVTQLNAIDQLRQFARVHFEETPAEPMLDIDATGLERLLERAAVYTAFEQIGGAEAFLEVTRDFTLQRFIFGQPLGSYQAIKHTLADLYAELELATCNALYAAQALAHDRPDARAAAATARIGANEVYEKIARQGLHYHGGIGFTWEGNCHFHYRRARTSALALGSTEFWSDRLVAEIPAIPQDERKPQARAKQVSEAADDAAYRAQARAWIDENLPKLSTYEELNETEAFSRRVRDWTKMKHAAGYTGIDRPAEFGGAGGSASQRAIFAQEEARAGIHLPVGGRGWVQSLAALNSHGTLEQRQKWESLTYAGETYWCQLFSEPGAGSDLAAVRTRAERRGDEWIVNGQKVWTTEGHVSDWAILLARTDPTVPKHKGLTLFLIDMHQPGVEARPIRQINGQSDFSETFLNDAVARDEDRIGGIGQGWEVAMSLLAQERLTTRGISAGGQRTSATSARSLIALAQKARREFGTALDSALVRSKIARFHAQAQGIKNFTLRMQEEMAAGQKSPVNLPVIKLSATSRAQLVQAFLMDLDETGGIVDAAPNEGDGDRFFDYVTAASARMGGGTDEVLRNQLAERALGLPREVRMDKDVPFNQLPH